MALSSALRRNDDLIASRDGASSLVAAASRAESCDLISVNDFRAFALSSGDDVIWTELELELEFGLELGYSSVAPLVLATATSRVDCATLGDSDVGSLVPVLCLLMARNGVTGLVLCFVGGRGGTSDGDCGPGLRFTAPPSTLPLMSWSPVLLVRW